MTRHRKPAAVAAGLGLPALALAAILGMTPDRPARTPYQTCIAAANTPGSSGFATEVCEPLVPGFQHPDVTP